MGNLVFQATLGGQVNLVGPNTASTYNLNVPAVASTLATLEAQTFNGTQTYTVDSVINGLTVGKGAGAVSTNTVVGASAMIGSNSGNGNNTAVGYETGRSNTTGAYNTWVGGLEYNNGLATGRNNTSGSYNSALGAGALANNTTASGQTAVGYQAAYSVTSAGGITAIGYQALTANTSGSLNVAVGGSALGANTTGANNTAVGYQAGYSGTTAAYNTFIGSTSGYSITAGTNNVAVGREAGYSLTTGVGNTFLGGGVAGSQPASGYDITTGSKNSILGNFRGNQGGLDIRTASNYIVLSDGDGNPRGYWDGNGAYTTQGTATQGTVYWTLYSLAYSLANVQFASVTTQGWNAAGAGMYIGKNGGTSRSINAGGTVNAAGLDYAEYMTKAGDFTVAKGDVVGINAEGKLTNVFADAVSFVVKSTDPSYVGGDTWGVELQDGTAEYDSARQKVDRIAFAGQVPVNVTGATAGQYIVPVNDNGAIKGEAISNPTFEQYQLSVGKVIAIEQDGRARIIVKVA